MITIKKLRFIQILLFFCLIFDSTLGQNFRKCNKCKEEIKGKYLRKYTQGDKFPIIENNWNEYFFENLEGKLNGGEKKDLNIINLRFDALGCIYPNKKFDFEESEKLINVFKKSNRVNFDGISFYNISQNTFESTQAIFWNKYLEIERNKIFNDDSLKRLKDYERQFLFTQKWNNFYMKPKIIQINEQIFQKNIEKIVFLVHGYNVPNSLAQIQYENIIDEYTNRVNCANILFLNIFWPSTAEKKITNKKDFYFRNRFKWRVISDFKSVVPRTYYISLSIRKLLNNINFMGDLRFISHSLGANVVSSTLIEPNKKMKAAYRKSTLRNLTINEFKNNKLNLTTKSIGVFMNAPAIGGVATFNDLDSTNHLHTKMNWFIGYNDSDKVLNRKLGRISFREMGDNTRLGGNKFGTEVSKTQDLVIKLGFKNNFRLERVGEQKDQFGHDFFCYLIQPKFNKEFEKFILR